jgi:hypothetical protein
MVVVVVLVVVVVEELAINKLMVGSDLQDVEGQSVTEGPVCVLAEGGI